jgi:N-acetylglucosaminyldiphosphoundecaprenol N-acetyl-beta-D-mannosaminyltransferase
MEKKNIHGVLIDNVDMDEALGRVMEMLESDRTCKIYTPNSEIIMQACRDPQLKEILNLSDLLVADGAGVVLASKILGNKLKQKVSGIDLVKRIFINTDNRPVSVFLFGGKPGVAEQAAINILSEFPRVDIKGFLNGYFTQEEEDGIIARINDSGAEILLVGLGAPKQEKWIHDNADRLKCKVAIGVGGTLDVFAGVVPLAPECMRRAGLEWLFRLIKEPKRYKRMMDLPRFILLSIRKRLSGRVDE